MRGNDFLEKMDLIDPEYVELADRIPANRPGLPRGWIAVAACFCALIVGAAFGIRPSQMPDPTVPDEHNDPITETQPKQVETIVCEPEIIWNPYFNEYADTGIVSDAMRIKIPGYFIEALTESQLECVCPKFRYDWSRLSGSAGYDGEGNLVDLFLTVTTSIAETEVSVVLSRYPVCCGIILDEDPQISHCGNLTYTLYQCNSVNGRTYLSAEAQQDDWYWRFAMDVPGEETGQAKADFAQILAGFASCPNGLPDFTEIVPESIPEYFEYELTHKEALQDPDFGAFFLPLVPDGYVPETITRYRDYRRDDLFALWSRGYDDLDWRVSRISEEDRARITFAAEREKYDLSLYPIPRADSVPEEIRQIVDDPIFLAEELTLSMVKARAYRIHDAGDTDGWRMRFGVLYGDILVQITTKGIEPEWLYQVLRDLFNP